MDIRDEEVKAAVRTMQLLADSASDSIRIGVGSTAITKSDGTPVSAVDAAINTRVIAEVKRRHPECGVLGEEESYKGGDGSRLFVVDPIDGTAAYVAGLGVACFSVAYVRDGVTQAAVIEDPFTFSRFVAVRGAGAELDGRKLDVGTEPRSNIVLFEAIQRSELSEELLFHELRAAKANPVRYLAFVNPAARVATGALAGAVFGKITPWDHLGVSLLVEEAGGVVSDFAGKPVCIDSDGVVLAHPNWHAALLEAVTNSRKSSGVDDWSDRLHRAFVILSSAVGSGS